MGYVVENRLTVAALHQRLRSSSAVQVGGGVCARAWLGLNQLFCVKQSFGWLLR